MKFIALIITFLLACTTVQALENLDEMESRGARRGTNTYYHGGIEGNSWVRQPETLIYTDVTTGHEVTILTNTPNDSNIWDDDISPASNFSADGKRIGFFSNRDIDAYTKTGNSSFDGANGVGFIMRSDGTYLRPIEDAADRGWGSAHRMFWTWNPAVPDIFYSHGDANNGLSLNDDDLYRNTVSDSSISYTKILDLPISNMRFWKMLSGDGTTVVGSADQLTFYPITVYPTPALLDSDGWNIDRGQDGYFGGSGDMGDPHDMYFPSATGEWFATLTSGSYTVVYKNDVTGSDADGGPHFNTSASYTNFDDEECEPLMAWRYTPIVPWDPDSSVYHGWGHMGFDRWGRCVSFQDGDSSPLGSVVWDYVNRVYIVSGNSTVVPSQGLGEATHGDWGAWSDYAIVSGETNGWVATFKYDESYTGSYDYIVAYHHGDQNSNNEDTAYHWAYPARPRQSPDGTKIAYGVNFLYNVANAGDIAYAVAYYPYPPEVSAVTATGGNVTLSAWWNLGTTPRGYTDRGWPDESANDPPPPREVNEFRLWRSTDKATWTPIKTFSHDVWDKFNFSTGSWVSGTEATNKWSTTDSVADGTYYYAVTSIENSGIESHTLSNIFSITVSSGSGTGSQDTAYPADPGGDDDITSSYDSALHRYYNIYAKDGSSPSISSVNRIASDPRTTKSYVDWLGNTSGTTQYVVTAVDTQGNESAALSSSYEHKATGATADGQYTITWTDGIGTANIIGLKSMTGGTLH